MAIRVELGMVGSNPGVLRRRRHDHIGTHTGRSRDPGREASEEPTLLIP